MLITVAKGSVMDYHPKKNPALQNFNKARFTNQNYSDATLLSADFQLDLLQQHVLASSQRLLAAMEVTRLEAKAQGQTRLSMDSILDQNSALSQEFARALIEHWTLQEFVNVEKQSGSTSPLTLVRQLHALWILDTSTDIVRRRYLDEVVQDRIRDLVGAAIHRVHENVDALVDAFGVPDHLSGTIAGDW
ncbi:hypothetical protein BGW38_002142, partial [Lunasporangiospora selenospora]